MNYCELKGKLNEDEKISSIITIIISVIVIIEYFAKENYLFFIGNFA